MVSFHISIGNYRYDESELKSFFFHFWFKSFKCAFHISWSGPWDKVIFVFKDFFLQFLLLMYNIKMLMKLDA